MENCLVLLSHFPVARDRNAIIVLGLKVRDYFHQQWTVVRSGLA